MSRREFLDAACYEPAAVRGRWSTNSAETCKGPRYREMQPSCQLRATGEWIKRSGQGRTDDQAMKAAPPRHRELEPTRAELSLDRGPMLPPHYGSEKTSPDAYWPSRGARSTRAVWTNKLKLERQQLPAPPIGTQQFQPLRHRTGLARRGVEFHFHATIFSVAGPPQDAALAGAPARGVGPPVR